MSDCIPLRVLVCTGECPCIAKLPGESNLRTTLEALLQPTPLVYLQIAQHGGSPQQKPHFMFRLAGGWRGLQMHGIAQAFRQAPTVSSAIAGSAIVSCVS